MSAIRERTVLCFSDLPKPLTSRKNLHAHFSKFGEVKDFNINKELRSGIMVFSSHFDAQAAKTQGKMFNGEPLNIFWSESSALDPRAKEQQDYDITETDPFWQEDEKECFGVEKVPSPRDQRKQAAKDIIEKHLKSSLKKRLGLTIVKKARDVGNKLDTSVSQRSPVKLAKGGMKTLVTLKKSLLAHNKRKLTKKEADSEISASVEQKKAPSSLQDHMIKTPASSVVERTDLKHKLALLDERDKLIRKATVQDSNIKTAVAIKGTCPDMCPERERIQRQFRHAVATYEMFTGTYEMDDSKAVKEYLRSSADQEVPLPHDLRPGHVLSMTMSYLITNIINRVDSPDENKGVWYSFCWNRLRSIRKDIIVQQLCDMGTVAIIEQCARFHISCYDHMCGAEVSSFDDKLNTQNLMDCLQSLRHSYEDLAKHDISCSNEAEFYSYLILLKLKSGDVMWEYQQYSPEIQRSPHMQFAIEAYMAFKNNMYSRYFSLVKRASYLKACLMQRYFDEVRMQALRTMLKAYCLPGKTVGLSSLFVVLSLKFDSHKDALRFCEREGVLLKVDFEENEQDQDVDVSTSCYLIKEKRLPISNAVVGEGSPLPVYVPQPVHSSFDEYGRLMSSLSVVRDDEHEQTLLEQSPNQEGEPETKMNSPEVVHQPAFKFSLSPTKIHENIFGPSLFPNQDQLDGKQSSDKRLQMNEQSHLSMNQDSTKTLNFNNSFGFSPVFEMEQDLQQEMVYEENEIQQTHNNVQQLFLSQNNKGPTKVTQFGLHQQFLIPSVSPIKNASYMFTGGEQAVPAQTLSPVQAVQDVGITKDNKNSFIFSFSVPEIGTKAFSEDNVHYTVKESNKAALNEKKETTFKFQLLRQHSGEIENRNKLAEQVEGVHSPNADMELSKTLAEEKEKEDLKSELMEAARQALLLEKLLKEKAEEERLRMEEIKRLEREKQKKKIEEQRALQMLKKDLSERLKAINVRNYARHWKERVEKLKKTRADFPALIQLSVTDYLSTWGTIYQVPTSSIFQRAKEKRNSIVVTSQLLQSGITESCKYIGSDLAEALAKSAARTMKKGAIKPVYWKLAVSVPWAERGGSELSVFNQLMKRWCRQSFYNEENACLGSVDQVQTSFEIPVNISTHFSDNFQSTQEFRAIDALVFVVLNEAESEEMCVQRLHSLVTSQVKSGEFSVAVMSIGNRKLERILDIELKKLHKQNIIADWTVNTWSNPSSVLESLKFLADHVNVAPHICASPLESLVKQVSEEFFDALNSGHLSSEGLSSACKDPNIVIYLYNTLLTKLEGLLMSSKLEKYFNFGEEFKMHVPLNESGGPELMCGKHYDDLYLSQISKKIHSVKLPEFKKWPETSPNRLVKMLRAYCIQVHDRSIFPQIIRMLDLPDETNLKDHLKNVTWLNFVELWAQCSIRHTFSSEKKKRLFVIFNKNDVQRMLMKQWWLKLPVVVGVAQCCPLTT